MIYSESIATRLNSYHNNSTIRSKIVSVIFMIMGLGSGIAAVITLLHRANVI